MRPGHRLSGRGEAHDRKCLRQARHAFEKDVTVGKEAVDEGPDQVVLPDDPLPDLREKPVHEVAVRLDLLPDLFDVDGHLCRALPGISKE